MRTSAVPARPRRAACSTTRPERRPASPGRRSATTGLARRGSPTSSPRLSKTGAATAARPDLALLPGVGVAAPANALELRDEVRPSRDRARRERRQRIGWQLDVAEREHHLPRSGCVPDTRPAELRDALHGGGAVCKVDRDGIVLTRAPKASPSPPSPGRAPADGAGQATAGRAVRARRSRARRGAATAGSAPTPARARRSAPRRASRAGARPCSR